MKITLNPLSIFGPRHPILTKLRAHPNYFHLIETVNALNPDVALRITQLSSDTGLDASALDAPHLSDRFLHFCDWTTIEPNLAAGHCDAIYMTFLDIEDTTTAWLDMPISGDQK